VTLDTGDVPLFPLPWGALLPGELLPLHVFEPRYRRMLRAAREGDKIIAIATVEEGWEGAALGSPPLAPVVGLGRIVKDRLNSDGTSDIVLHGLGRGRIARELPRRHFRHAHIELEPAHRMHPVVAFRLRRRLLEGLGSALSPDIGYDVTARFDVGVLADRIASSLRLSPASRARIMQASEPEDRIQALLELLTLQKHRTRLRDIIPSLGDFSLSLRDDEESAP